MKNILIIGGTGIIGKPTAYMALEAGFNVTTINYNLDGELPKTINQIVVNKQDISKYTAVCNELNKSVVWDAVVDIYNLGKTDAEMTYHNFKKNTKHFFVISTTLVYDRRKPLDRPIKSSDPLSPLGLLGGYADNKIELEHVWRSVTDVPWTILRPYHIVGSGSLLGCVPDENRNPKLLSKIMNGEELVLCEGGDIPFNYIHPNDIAEIILRSIGNEKTMFKAYNAVNPTVYPAKDYFKIIGSILGKEISIQHKPLTQVWAESEGWELTTLPHTYDTADLEADVGYSKFIPLEAALREAIAHYPNTEQGKNEISVHQRMTLEPHPSRIDWLFTSRTA